jgi:hypothetical protein
MVHIRYRLPISRSGTLGTEVCENLVQRTGNVHNGTSSIGVSFDQISCSRGLNDSTTQTNDVSTSLIFQQLPEDFNFCFTESRPTTLVHEITERLLLDLCKIVIGVELRPAKSVGGEVTDERLANTPHADENNRGRRVKVSCPTGGSLGMKTSKVDTFDFDANLIEIN